MAEKRRSYTKNKWPRKNLGEIINFLEQIYPEGISIDVLSKKLGVTKGSVSNMFVHDNMKLSKAEEISRIYGFSLSLFFPKRHYGDDYEPPKTRYDFPNAGNLTGLVRYFQDSGYSLSLVAEKNHISPNVLTRAFRSGDINLKTLNNILDELGLCVIWKFTPNDIES